MTICPDFGLPARIWFSLPGFYFPSPDLTLAIHILPSLPAVDSTCWKCTLPAQFEPVWVFLLRFHYSARIWLSLILVSQPNLFWIHSRYPYFTLFTPVDSMEVYSFKFESFSEISLFFGFEILIFLLGFDCLYSDMTICPDFGLPARIWFSLPGFYFPSPDLTLAIHILPSLPAVDSTCWKCTLPAQIWAFLLRFHYSARIWLSLPYFESICRMYFSLQDFNIFARIWLFILGYDYLPWFWSPSTNLIFASWVLLSLPWFDSRYPYFTLFTRSWLHLLEVYSSCPNLSLSAEISLFCSDLTLPAIFWIHVP